MRLHSLRSGAEVICERWWAGAAIGQDIFKGIRHIPQANTAKAWVQICGNYIILT